MENIHSPLTDKTNVKLVTEIPVSIIESQYKKDYNLNVRRFFKTKRIQIFECLSTGFKFYYPFDIVGDDKLYEELQKVNGYYSIWNWEHKVVLKLIKPEYKVLEVGCGTGSFIEKLRKNSIEAYGLELNNDAVKVCKAKGLNVFHELLDEHLKENHGKYDLVCSFQVLEHVVDPKSFISECIDAVKPGGKIIFGVPNNNPYLFKRDKYHTLNLPPHHMGLWSVEAFMKLPDYYKIALCKVHTEELFNKQYYFNVFLDHNKMSFAKNIFGKLPNIILRVMAKIGKWKGRNLVAVFEKL